MFYTKSIYNDDLKKVSKSQDLSGKVLSFKLNGNVYVVYTYA